VRQRPVASRLRCITYAWGSYPEDVRAQQHYGPFDRPLRQDRNLIRDKELFVDLLIDLTVCCTSTFLWRWEKGYTITHPHGGNPANYEHAGFVAWGAEAVRYIYEFFISFSLMVISCSP